MNAPILHESDRGARSQTARRPHSDQPLPAAIERHLWEIRPVQDVLWIVTTALMAWGLYALRTIFIPVFIAWLLAYLANPVVQFSERRWSWPRPLTVSLFLVLFTILTAGTIVLIGPLVSDQVQTLAKKTPVYADWLMQKFAMVGRLSTQIQSLVADALHDPLSMLQPLFAGTGQAFGLLGLMVGATVNAALLVFLIPLYFFFFSWHFDRMLTALARFIPRSRREHTLAVLHRMDAAVSGFFRERLLIALISGFLYAAVWGWTGVPYWFLLGIGTGILTLVPYLSAIGWPLAVLFKYMDSLTGSDASVDWVSILVWPSAAYLAVQFIESWMLTPWIQRRSSEMSAVTLVIVLFVGGAVGGLFGLIFAIPIAACIKIVFQEWVLPQWATWAAEH
jgi:predicted PurR-regulated permease PerM